MSEPIQQDSQVIYASNANELRAILKGCRDSGRRVVTVDSHLLRTSNWMSDEAAVRLDVSRMSQVSVDTVRKIALVGPGAKFSSFEGAVRSQGMTVDIEPLASIDFTFGDWAHESLRMLSAVNSGLDGILRNVKVVAPDISYQTGYDNFPANGGGYDLTKMFMTSFLALGVPYEFAIPIRPIPDVETRKTYEFSALDRAVRAGIAMYRSGFASLLTARTSGAESMMLAGKTDGSGMVELIVRFEGTPALVDAAEKVLDEIAKKEGGKEKEKSAWQRKLVDPSLINPAAWLIGVCAVDTLGLASVVKEISNRAAKAGRSVQIYVSDIDPNVSILVPILQGPPNPDIVKSIGSYLVDQRITLRGNVAWNPLLGDSRSPPRIDLLKRIKSCVDSRMILNSHVMGAMR